MIHRRVTDLLCVDKTLTGDLKGTWNYMISVLLGLGCLLLGDGGWNGNGEGE